MSRSSRCACVRSPVPSFLSLHCAPSGERHVRACSAKTRRGAPRECARVRSGRIYSGGALPNPGPCGYVRVCAQALKGQMSLTSEKQLSDEQSRSVAGLVREELARRRISRKRLADLAKISISTLEKALSGRRPFTLATTVRLEEALGVGLRAKGPDVPAAPSGLAPGELGF